MQIGGDFHIRHQFELGNELTSPIAGSGPNIGHKTPTKVFAKTGVQSTEPQKTRARNSFFIEFRPRSGSFSQLAPIPISPLSSLKQRTIAEILERTWEFLVTNAP